ncbi:MAG: chloride channel protein [Pyramidobacter sp.]|nr:chloride channel protein [Pyramidobacter sp.]
MKKLYALLTAYGNTIMLGLAAIPVGVAAGLVDSLFGRVLLELTEVRLAHPYALIPFLALAGAAIVWCMRRLGGASVKGMTLIFEAGHGVTDDIPLRLIPLAIGGTWLTHLFGGSSGREGVAVQIGGTIGHAVGKELPLKNAGRLMLIAGMAAGFAGLFRTPLAATFFAIEVLTAGVLEYRAIFPAMVAAFVASRTSGLCGLGKFTFALSGALSPTLETGARLIVLGAAFGITGGLFAWTMHRIKDGLARLFPHPLVRVLTVGACLSVLSLLCWGGRYSGVSTQLIGLAFEGKAFPWDFALKALFTIVTLSAGFLGGEVVPLFVTGATLGSVIGPLIGLPPAYAAALGCVAVFGGATNTLLGPIVIGGEIFGFAHLPYIFVACTVAYVCNGNSSIYKLQKGRF